MTAPTSYEIQALNQGGNVRFPNTCVSVYYLQFRNNSQLICHSETLLFCSSFNSEIMSCELEIIILLTI